MIKRFPTFFAGRIGLHASAAVMALVALCMVPQALADDPKDASESEAKEKNFQFYGQGGGYIHWNDDPDFEGPPISAGIEARTPSKWFGGILLFNNSFGEFSQYYYVGKQWNPFEKRPYLNLKLSGGLIYGYSDDNIDEFPVHFGGFGPVLVPSIGYKKGRVGYDIAIMGQAGLMFMVGVDLN